MASRSVGAFRSGGSKAHKLDHALVSGVVPDAP
jgi:hypothetical protein